jgi:2-hydroxychromene-2-carboxylate isomerase
VPYPVDPDLLANRVAVVAAEDGWCPEFATAIYRGWFADHKPPHDLENLQTVLRSLKQDPAAVLARADSADIRAKLDGETAAARELGIFGAPTFAIGKEIFWGGDRLDDALACAAKH